MSHASAGIEPGRFFVFMSICDIELATKPLDTYLYFDMGNVHQKLSVNTSHLFKDTRVVFQLYHKPLITF
jgi:hypothetical protein